MRESMDPLPDASEVALEAALDAGSARAMISVFVRLRQLERVEKLLAEITRRIGRI